MKKHLTLVGFIYALLLVNAAIFLGVAFLSYHPEDPSWNHATAMEPKNWLGIEGAYLADFLYNFYGVSALLLIPSFLIWGWLYLRGAEKHPWLRWCIGLIVLHTTPLLIALSLVARHGADAVPFAEQGVVGWMLEAAIHPYLEVVAGGIWAVIAGLVLWNIWALSFVWSIGFSDWKRAFSHTAWMVRLVGHYSYTMLAWAKWCCHRMMVRQLEKPRIAPLVRLEQEFEEEDEESAPPKKRIRPRVAPVVPSANEGEYALPPTDLLKLPPTNQREFTAQDPRFKASIEALRQVLQDYSVEGEIIQVHPGPVVVLYEFEPAPGVKSSRVIGLADDIARSMSALAVRIAVVPGRNVIGIELPSPERQTVYLRSLLEAEIYHRQDIRLPIVLGKTIIGEPIVADLARMPHLLIAGTTGSGKSVAINTMVLSLLYRLTPAECKFIMIDPKMLELSVYDGIPHLLSPVVTEPGKAVVALKWTVKEMENRYRLMSTLGVRNVESYNQRIQEALANGEVLEREVLVGFDPDTGKPKAERVPLAMEPLPFIVVIVDEMADLMLVAGKDIESSVQRLAQMARAAGIHIIMATQRPSVDVITGVIKANFPTRISFQVTSRIDSRTILGEQGAEQLLGMGDMLYMAGGGKITRIHGPFVSDQEVERVVTHWKAQQAPNYIEDITAESEGGLTFSGSGDGDEGGDALYDQAVALVIEEGKASTSFIQRHLRIGYNRAATLIDRMEKEGVISAANHVGKREVLMGQRA